MKQNKKKAMKVPFYAQLLSRQEMQHAGGNAALQTKKYPSDQEDTDPLWDQAQTHKWPSDGDESTPVNDQVD